MTTHRPALADPVGRAALLLGVEGVGIAVVGAVYAVVGVVGEPEDRFATVLAGGCTVLAGVLVLLVARGVGGVRLWARSPAVVLQLLALPVGLGLVQGHVWAAAAVVLGLAGAVLYQLATPQARLAFREPGPTPR
jgi:hypothetical protein